MSKSKVGNPETGLFVAGSSEEVGFVLSVAEVRLIERLRAMRPAASKMVFDLSEECECVFRRAPLPRLALVRRSAD